MVRTGQDGSLQRVHANFNSFFTVKGYLSLQQVKGSCGLRAAVGLREGLEKRAIKRQQELLTRRILGIIRHSYLNEFREF